MTSGRRTKYREVVRRGVPKGRWTTNVGKAAGDPAAFIVVVLMRWRALANHPHLPYESIGAPAGFCSPALS
jgi:hypothetical protein